MEILESSKNSKKGEATKDKPEELGLHSLDIQHSPIEII